MLGAPKLAARTAAIELRHLTLRVGTGRAERILIENLTISFKPGTISAIVGKSGSGKTTLLRAIAGMIRPDSGQIILCDRDTAKLSSRISRRYIRQTVATVTQDANLISVFTAKENIAFALHMAGVSCEPLQVAESWLKRFDLWTIRDEYPCTMSGGEKQRIAIARALALPHPIILADEPTGALDAENSRLVIESLKEHVAANKCIIVASHDSDIAAAAQFTYHLRDGILS